MAGRRDCGSPRAVNCDAAMRAQLIADQNPGEAVQGSESGLVTCVVVYISRHDSAHMPRLDDATLGVTAALTPYSRSASVQQQVDRSRRKDSKIRLAQLGKPHHAYIQETLLPLRKELPLSTGIPAVAPVQQGVFTELCVAIKFYSLPLACLSDSRSTTRERVQENPGPGPACSGLTLMYMCCAARTATAPPRRKRRRGPRSWP